MLQAHHRAEEASQHQRGGSWSEPCARRHQDIDVCCHKGGQPKRLASQLDSCQAGPVLPRPRPVLLAPIYTHELFTVVLFGHLAVCGFVALSKLTVSVLHVMSRIVDEKHGQAATMCTGPAGCFKWHAVHCWLRASGQAFCVFNSPSITPYTLQPPI